MKTRERTWHDGDLLVCHKDTLIKSFGDYRDTHVCTIIRRNDGFTQYIDPGTFQYIDLSAATGDHVKYVAKTKNKPSIHFRFNAGKGCEEAEHPCKLRFDDWWGISMRCESECVAPASL